MTKAFTAEAHRAAMLRARIALDEATIGPSEAMLAEAPLLRLWQPLLMGRDVCLAGEVTGHPQLSVDFITTSPLIALGPKLAWARTMSRFYRLDRYLPLIIKEGLASDNQQNVVIVDAYGWPALDLPQVETYLAGLAELIRAKTTVN